jgi:hypothetical protein
MNDFLSQAKRVYRIGSMRWQHGRGMRKTDDAHAGSAMSQDGASAPAGA